MYTSLIFAFLVIALTLYLVLDNKRVTGFASPYFKMLGKGQNVVLTLLAFGYLALLGASLYIVYKYAMDPTVPISYEDAFGNLIVVAESEADKIGDEISNLEGNSSFKVANYGVGSEEQVNKHLMTGRDLEPKLVSPHSLDACGPIIGGKCGPEGNCQNTRFLARNGQVLISPPRDFPFSWVQ